MSRNIQASPKGERMSVPSEAKARTKHPRKPAWYKRFRGAAMKATIQTPSGATYIDYVGSLTDEQYHQIFDVLFPKKSKSAS